MLTVGSLFAGIGGFDLGFERAGFLVQWQVEKSEWCRAILRKHWPNVRRHDDVKTFPPKSGKWEVDCIIGGFPCQDLSRAGNGAGIDGSRSGLWSELHRVVCVLRPRFVVLENVAAILDGGIGRVVGDLAASGYDSEWDCLPACAFGADHVRDRFFLVGWSVPVAEVLHIDGQRRGEQHLPAVANRPRVIDWSTAPRRVHGWDRPTGIEPVVGRVADGIPNRVDRLRGLGNSIVPDVAEWVGRQLMGFIQKRSAVAT